MQIKVGCCGFSEAHHKYYNNFKLVEVQNTFYQPPKTNTAVKWRNASPDDFEFTLKAWQLITHKATSPTYKRLRPPISARQKPKYGFFSPTREVFRAWGTTREFANYLGAKAILFQCPSGFRQSEENVRNLRKFFQTINREPFKLIWEPRGSWQPEMIRDLCEELDLIHGVDPFQNESVTDSMKYYRLHGKSGYHSHYSNEDLLRLKEICERDEHVYCLFNNMSMRIDALRFLELLASDT